MERISSSKVPRALQLGLPHKRNLSFAGESHPAHKELVRHPRVLEMKQQTARAPAETPLARIPHRLPIAGLPRQELEAEGR